MLELTFVDDSQLKRMRDLPQDSACKWQLLAAVSRLNALSSIRLAGSGHIGSSFSALDIFTLLYFSELNTLKVGLDHPDRDIFFSSKGHDCPGQYSVLATAGVLSVADLKKLRRLGGLPGHPEVNISGMEINSGSLGMGISKAKGMALAKKLKGYSGRVMVMLGDGELQEGQIWETLQTTAYQKIHNVIAIVDANQIQSDKSTKDTLDTPRLEEKFQDFGWHVERCDGHDFYALQKTFRRFDEVTDKPKILIADTIKGKGVSFMEGPTALQDAKGVYKWHAGAPSVEAYETAREELVARIKTTAQSAEYGVVEFSEEKISLPVTSKTERVVDAFGEALAELGEKHKELIVLDADLATDCCLRAFEAKFPDRFLENGIAEQDMVSTAGGLALQGFLPVVNSFGCFLASRACEQIYINATEKTKVIYACHYAGILPAGPGKSHQSLRDIALFSALPNCTVMEPCNEVEAKALMKWSVEEAEENCMIRLIITPSPSVIEFPESYSLKFGQGTVLREGSDAILFAYGPIMLNEALKAQSLLAKQSLSLKVVNMPWLNRMDEKWFEEVTQSFEKVFVLDNHMITGGLGERIQAMSSKPIVRLGVKDHPAFGNPDEVLRHHGLDAESISSIVTNQIKLSTV